MDVLPNDRPHQFKFDGSYRTPWKLLVGASFRAQSGIPFNQLIPHPVYGNNEGFGVPAWYGYRSDGYRYRAGFPEHGRQHRFEPYAYDFQSGHECLLPD